MKGIIQSIYIYLQRQKISWGIVNNQSH